MVVHANNVVNYEIICQKLRKIGTIRTGSVISIPCKCSISSKALNISTYTVSVKCICSTIYAAIYFILGTHNW